MSGLKIAVIGGGIIGLTTAVRIKEEIRDSQVTVYAQEFSPNTASDLSNGYWEPFCFSEKDCSKEKGIKWAKESYDRFIEACITEGQECGAQMILSFVLSQSYQIEEPIWSDFVMQYKKLSENDLKRLGFADNANSGFGFLSTAVEMKKYLPYLMKKLEKMNVKFVKKTISELTDLIDDCKYDYIINCTEIGAMKLFCDANIYKIKGHVLTVNAPWIKFGIIYKDYPEGCTYIIPLSSSVMLGGSIEKDPPDENINKDECQRIFDRCSKLVKNLKQASRIDDMVCNWSARRGGVRIESESIKCRDIQVKVVHNYGHGGQGITFSWGCASEVVDIIKNKK